MSSMTMANSVRETHARLKRRAKANFRRLNQEVLARLGRTYKTEDLKNNYLKTIAVPLAAGLLAAVAALPAPAAKPNFLFMFTDDQRWDAIGAVQREQGEKARFPWFQSPNLDRLAAEGVRFRNAFVVNSLCAPSRANFLTGRYSHLNGVVNNHTPFPTNSVTYATHLRAAGYTAAYIGKWHMGSQSGKRPSFDYSASFIGQGKYYDCPVEINGEKTATKGWIDDVTTDYAIEFIRRHKDQPFAVTLGFKATHGPWDEPPERVRHLYQNDIPKPPVNGTNTAIYRPSLNPATAEGAANIGNKRAEMQRNYLRILTAMDHNVGRLLQVLDDLKLAENTVVVFSSDNGYYLGEHGLGDKRSAYDESLRIPLLLRYPKLAPKGVALDQMVLNLDLAPTFLDLAGVPVPPEMQGLSLKPLLVGAPGPWRKSFFYNYFYERGFTTPTVLAVRTETAKLIKYPGHDEWTEVFDLAKDPYEQKNLAKDPAAAELVKALQEEFDRQAKAINFAIPDYADKPGDEDGDGKKKGKAGKKVAALEGPVLLFNFDQAAGAKVTDTSGQNNHGRAAGVQIVEGRAGRKAARFDGRGSIEVAKSESLDCAGSPWTFEAVLKAEKPDGVVLARGGATAGYALVIRDGKPEAVVNVNNQTHKAAGSRAVTGEWTHLAGVITAKKKLRLYVNGDLAAETDCPLLDRDPNDSMQVGTDTGSQLMEYPKGAGFTGLIESVRLHAGARSAEDIKKSALP